MVKKASRIARGCVRTATTTPTTLCNIATILQLICWLRHTALVYCITAYIFDTGRPCYGQLTPVKTRYLLTRITWPYYGLKFRTHQGHVCLKVDRWPSTGFFFNWIAGLLGYASLTYCNQGRVVRRPVNANPGLKVNQRINFSCIKMFFTFCFV